MESAFTSLMPHAITIEPVTGYDVEGAPSYGTAVATRGLVTLGPRRIVRRDGQEVVARGIAYCAGPLSVPVDAVITVPATFGLPDRMLVLDARHYSDETGAVHNVEVIV